MTNIKPLNGIAAVVHLPFIQMWTEIEKSQPELRARHHPRPGAKIGEASALPKMTCAYLIIKGEVTETLHLKGLIPYNHSVRIMQAGAVFLLQAIDSAFQTEKLMCTYTAGNYCEIQTLTETSASALGLTPEIRSYIIREEQRLLESFIALHEQQDVDLEFAEMAHKGTQDRLAEAHSELSSKEAEITHLRKDNARLTASFQDLEVTLEKLTESNLDGNCGLFNSDQLNEFAPESVIAMDTSVPIEDASQDLLEEVGALQSADAEEGDPQESTKNGVAPPSIFPLRCDSEAVTLAPPQMDEVPADGHRPTMDYQHIPPFPGPPNEELPPLSEHCDSRAPTQTNIQPLQIPQQTGVENFQAVVDETQESEDLSEPEGQRRMTLIHAAVWPANATDEHAPPSSISGPLSRGTPLRVPSIRHPFDPKKP